MNPGLAFWYLHPLDDGRGWIVRDNGDSTYTVQYWDANKYGAQPTGSTLTDAYNNAVAYQAAVASDDYDTAGALAPTLQLAIRNVFAKISTDAKSARMWTLQTSIDNAFERAGNANGGDLKETIRELITRVVVTSDSELVAIQTELLTLSQWSA